MKASLKVILVLFAAIVFTACGIKPQYATKQGKKKNSHYNSIQYPTTPGRVKNERNTK